MAFKLVPRGWETSSTTGTGALTLAGAVTDYPNTGDTWRAFSDDLSNNDTTYYAVVNRTTQTEWEEGIGTWGTGGILTRTTIIRSSNSNNAVSFTAGTKDVMCTPITSAAVSPGTSGGVLYFSAANTPASSAALAANGVVLGGGAGAAPFTDAGLTYNATTDALTVAGTINLPTGSTKGITINDGASGAYIFQDFNGDMSFKLGTVRQFYLDPVGASVRAAGFFAFSNGADAYNTRDASIGRAGVSNSVIFSATVAAGGGGGGLATSRAEINKAVTAFTDGVAKATFTVTIPNASHNATLEVEVTGICGAGGAIGAGECSATNSYKFNISRTAGVNAAVGVSAAYGAATSAVAGATTLTATAAASAVAGGVGAVNTFTVDVTITKGGGASDNHVALMYGKLMNANASGITIA